MSTKDEVVKVSRNYQITIPAKVREKFPVKEGDLVKVILDESTGTVKIAKMEPWK